MSRTKRDGSELVDISCSGARLHGAQLPEKDDEVMLSVGEVKAFGKKQMPAADWARGVQLPAGTVLGP